MGLPITVRMVTWPVWMIASSEDEYPLPPILELNIGMRRRWFELSLEVGIATGKMFDAPGTYFGLGVSVGFYSLRLNRIRLRHGISMGLLSDAIFERRPERIGMMPMPMLRIRALDILVRLGGRWWLEISPLTTGFPTLYEASLGFRYELPDPTGPTGPTGPAGPPEAAGMRRPVDRTLHPFVSLEMGLVWWHHFEPSVVASTFGRVGFRYDWFETALGFGSPAWASWRTRGLYELFADVAFYSLRRARLRLRHQVRVGLLFHSPPFELHTWSGIVMHADLCIVALGLGRGFWAELSPLTISIAPTDHLSSSLALRKEF